jgi:iron complex transport system permease protein
MIGFISLVAPQMVRMMVGSDQRYVLIFSMFLGGLLLLVADTLARTVALPAEMPVGIFTSLIGAPYFLYLVKKRAAAFHG